MSRFAWDAERHGLGNDSLDGTHREFLSLARELECASPTGFAAAFAALAAHTAAHFAAEEASMHASACPTLAEHVAEHTRVLGDLRRFQNAIERGRPAMARAFVADSLADWFDAHVASMDAALAMHLRDQ